MTSVVPHGRPCRYDNCLEYSSRTNRIRACDCGFHDHRAIERFLPSYTEIRPFTHNGQRRHDKEKLLRTFFPGYLFACLKPERRAAVLSAPVVFELLRSPDGERVELPKFELQRIGRLVVTP